MNPITVLVVIVLIIGLAWSVRKSADRRDDAAATKRRRALQIVNRSILR